MGQDWPVGLIAGGKEKRLVYGSILPLMPGTGSRKVYANGVKDISLGLPHGRLPQVARPKGI